MRELIIAEGLTKDFDRLRAVEDLSLRVKEGEVLALLGPNGAGKTTTIRMLSCILRPSAGCASVAGFDVLEQPEAVRRSVGMLTEHHGLYTRMKAPEYLAFFGSLYGIPEAVIRERTMALLSRYGLEEAMDRRLGEYSKGMRQKLALVRAMLHEPSVLLLDEPTSAMDPASARLVRESISTVRSGNRAIVVCTHNLTEAEELADRIAIISAGRIVAYGTVPELKRALLGEPIMELRLARPLDGAIRYLPEEVDLLESGEDWVRYRVSLPEQVNPKVLENLARAGIPVVTLMEVGRSLEEVYLQVVSETGGPEELVL